MGEGTSRTPPALDHETTPLRNRSWSWSLAPQVLGNIALDSPPDHRKEPVRCNKKGWGMGPAGTVLGPWECPMLVTLVSRLISSRWFALKPLRKVVDVEKGRARFRGERNPWQSQWGQGGREEQEERRWDGAGGRPPWRGHPEGGHHYVSCRRLPLSMHRKLNVPLTPSQVPMNLKVLFQRI